MPAKTFSRSFAGGEISPLLRARLDLAKNQTGLALCKNYFITPQGPAENRAGFQFIVQALDAAAILIPFTYSSEQAYALEFGPGYIRFHTLGATLLEAGKAITGITQANPGVFTIPAHGFAFAEWVYLAGIGGMTGLNGRWAIVATIPDANHVTLVDTFGTPINTTAMPAFTAGGTAAHVYKIATPYSGAELLDLHYVQSADVLTIVHPTHAPHELRRLGATNWTLTPISFTPSIAAPAAPPGLTGIGPGGGTPLSHEYVTTAVAASTQEESERSASSTASWDLTVVGNALDVTPTAVAGAVRYNVYKQLGGIFGYIGQSDGSQPFRDVNIFPDMSKTPPEGNTPFAAENPRAVSYFDQRRVFGGGSLSPQTIWMTRSGTESNTMYSIPQQDDDAITARIVAREANTVRHIVPMGDLLAITSGGVWKITASDGGAITPSTFSARPQSRIGASNVQPVATSDFVVYVQDRGNHIREVAYKWESQSYAAGDVSVLAPHLFDFHSIRQLAASVAPTQIVWCVREDGVLLGMTYQPEHEVKAWHWHDTAGLFKSVCAIPEGTEDGVYVVVQRVINGGPHTYIERLHSRQFASLVDCFFVDSGLTYSGAPVSTIIGLWHLEGATVSILADGGVHPVRTVVGGSITLEAPYSKVHVGLRYNSDLQTMPLALEGAAAFGQDIPKNVNKATLSVYQSSAIKAGPSFDNLREYPQRSAADPYGSPPGMKTGMAELALDPVWQQEGSVCVRQDQPLPLTLRAIVIEVATGG